MPSNYYGDERNVTHPLSGLQILVVEDDAFIAMDCQESLLEAGAAGVEVAKSKVAVMRLLLSHVFDVVVIDVHLGGDESGIPIAHDIMQRGVPFVFCTGTSASVAIPTELDHIAVISKPYEMRELVHAIQHAAQPQHG